MDKGAVLRSAILGIVIAAGITLFIRDFHSRHQQFLWEAESFLHGKASVDARASVDMAIRDGNYYWPEGPFPALLLMPGILLFGSAMEQGYLQAAGILLLGVMLSRYTRRKGYSGGDTAYLLAAYLFGTVFIGIAAQPSSWYLSQITAVLLLTLLILEWESRRRFFVLGILIAMLLATRPTAAVFGGYIFYRILTNESPRLRMRFAAQYLIPIGIGIILLGWFNWVRFGSVFDSGYAVNILTPDELALRKLGLFSPLHIPRNIYWYFLAGFVPVVNTVGRLVFPFLRYNRWGLSFFIVAPFFFYAFGVLRNNTRYIRGLWITCGVTLLGILMFFNTGADQFGPRYTADFLPLLYILLLEAIPGKRLTGPQKTIIMGSALFNMYLLWATRVF